MIIPRIIKKLKTTRSPFLIKGGSKITNKTIVLQDMNCPAKTLFTIYPHNYTGRPGCTVTVKYGPETAKNFYWADINWYVLTYPDPTSWARLPLWSSAKAVLTLHKNKWEAMGLLSKARGYCSISRQPSRRQFKQASMLINLVLKAALFLSAIATRPKGHTRCNWACTTLQCNGTRT